MAEKHIPLFDYFPKDLVEPKNFLLFLYTFIIELIFFVFIPANAYYWFYTAIPFSGIRGGVAVSLFLVIIGIIPFAILMQFRIKFPIVFMLYQILAVLIKITGSLAIIGYLYSL